MVKTSKTTRHVSGPLPDIQKQASLTKTLVPGTLAIVIDGKREPIFLEDVEKVLLGRAPVTTDIPLLDFSIHNGFLLGVSRHHAIITRKDDGYLLRDEGSSNGTWVNRTLLQPHVPHPVQSGDIVRLGQLSFYLYFNNTRTDVKALHFRRSSPDKPFTPQELATALSPYLLAISRVQDVVNTLLRRQDAVVKIEAIDIEAASIEVQLIGASETVDFLQTKMPSLKLEDKTELEDKTVPSAEAARLDSAKNSSPTFENLSAEGKEKLAQLARVFLSDLSSLLQEKALNLEPYAQGLLPDFYILATSEMKINNNTENG